MKDSLFLKKLITDLQTLQEETHAVTVEKHLTVVRRLICDVPQSTPGELHHLVTLKDMKSRHDCASDHCLAPSV